MLTVVGYKTVKLRWLVPSGRQYSNRRDWGEIIKLKNDRTHSIPWYHRNYSERELHPSKKKETQSSWSRKYPTEWNRRTCGFCAPTGFCKLQTGKVGCWIFLTLSCPAENGTHLLPVNTDKSELQRTSLSSCDCVGKTQADFSWARQRVWKQIWGENSTFYPEKTLNETSLGWSILRKSQALQEKDKKGMHWTPQSAVSQRFVFSPSFFLFSLHPIHFHCSITT